jgi:hypothetical protein
MKNPSVIIMQSRQTGIRPGNVKSYKIYKLFYDLSSVMITQDRNWPNHKHKSQASLQNKYKTQAVPER